MDEICEGDYTLTPCGYLGSKTAVAQVDLKFLREFETDEEALEWIHVRMEKEQFWPNIWFVSDHGNWEIYRGD